MQGNSNIKYLEHSCIIILSALPRIRWEFSCGHLLLNTLMQDLKKIDLKRISYNYFPSTRRYSSSLRVCLHLAIYKYSGERKKDVYLTVYAGMTSGYEIAFRWTNICALGTLITVQCRNRMDTLTISAKMCEIGIWFTCRAVEYLKLFRHEFSKF